MAKPGTEQTPYRDYVAVNAGDEMMEFILTEDMRRKMNMAWRVWTLAVIRMNNWGHAGFKPGELALLATGEDTRSTRGMVSKAIKNLGEMGWIKPPAGEFGSTQHCIIVNPRWAYRGAGRASNFLCAEPTHFGRQKERWDVDMPGKPEPAVSQPEGQPQGDVWDDVPEPRKTGGWRDML